MNRRARTLTRATVAATAAVLLLTSAAAAADDVLTPERRARLDPANHPGATLQRQDSWRVSGTRDGAVPGLPGNRHVFTVVLRDAVGYENPGDDPEQVPNAFLDLVSQECDAGGACADLLRVGGTVLRPAGLVTSDGGPASLDLVVTDATPGVDVFRAPGVPAGPLPIHLTITPTSPPADPGFTLATVQSVNDDRGPDGGTYVARLPVAYRDATATGTVFGIAPAPGDEVQASRFAQLHETLAPTPPVRTAAGRRPYVPRVSRGAIVDDVKVSASAFGTFTGQPVTSTGHRFPGNRTSAALELFAGAGSAGLTATVLSLQCPAADSPFADCTRVPAPQLTPLGNARAVAGPDGTVAATRLLGVAPADVSTTDPDAWGTIRLSVAVAPGRSGRLTAPLNYVSDGDTAFVSGLELLEYDASRAGGAPRYVAALG
jgi:hypothetical protein